MQTDINFTPAGTIIYVAHNNETITCDDTDGTCIDVSVTDNDTENNTTREDNTCVNNTVLSSLVSVTCIDVACNSKAASIVNVAIVYLQ